jgi:isocitrate dehydrogenase
MLLGHLGWSEAAERLEAALARVLKSRRLTADLAAGVEGAELLSTAVFGRAVAEEAS